MMGMGCVQTRRATASSSDWSSRGEGGLLEVVGDANQQAGPLRRNFPTNATTRDAKAVTLFSDWPPFTPTNTYTTVLCSYGHIVSAWALEHERLVSYSLSGIALAWSGEAETTSDARLVA